MSILQQWGMKAQRWCDRVPFLKILFGKSWEAAPGIVLAGSAALGIIGLVGGALNRGAAGALVGVLSGGCLGAIVGGLIGRTKVPKEEHVSLAIELARPEAQYGAGEVIEGYVRVSSDTRIKSRGVRVYLACRGQFAHDQPSGGRQDLRALVRRTKEYLVQEVKAAPAGTLPRGTNAAYRFQFTLPREVLPTHQGYACTIEWSLHAVLDREEGEPVRARRELIIAATPPAIQFSQEGYQAVRPTELCQLALVLERRVVAEGEEISGHVRIAPHESFDADEVRVLLLRVENNPQGENHIVYIRRWDATSGQFEAEARPGGLGTTYVWLEDEANLGGPFHLELAQTKVFPFTLKIPKNWRPSFSTPEGSVTWQVVGLVGSRGGDIRVAQDVIVHTGAPQIARVLAEPKRSQGPSGRA